MNLNKFFCGIFLIFLKMISVNCGYINMSIYYKFPPLHEYDYYERCFYENPSKLSTYCMTDIQVIPNNQSELWRNIEEFNEDNLRHFRHDKMFYGICIEWCENMLKDLSGSEREQLYNGLLPNKKLVDYNDDLYFKEDENRKKYNKIVNQCLNFKFQKQYNLSVTSYIKYCDTNKDKIEFDNLDIAFIIITIILFSLNGLSTLYDLHLKRKRPVHLQTNQYYKEPIKNIRQHVLLAFSVCRNYFRLTKLTYDSTSYNKELRFADCFKFVMMLAVITTHVAQLQISCGFQNTEYIEKFLHQPDKNILINGTGLMQSFFEISGFLIMINFHENISKLKGYKIRSIPLFFKMLFFRYIRLTPLLAYGVFFNSTIFLKLGRGPLWRFAAEREKVFCRRNWWITLFYLQNYVDVEKTCMPQSWYISVDLQAYIVCSFIMILCYKHPHRANLILGTSIFIATIMAAIPELAFDLSGLYFHHAEYFRHFAYFNVDFKKIYVPLHMNLVGHLCGLLTGKVFLYFKSINFKMSDSKLRIFVFYAIIPLTFALILTQEFYYQYKVPSILAALHGSLYRITYGLLFMYFVIGLADKIGWMAVEFCNLSVFRILGRLTYSVLVIQVSILFFMFAEIRTLQYQTDFRLLIYVLGYVVFIYAVAFFITIILELPITALMKVLIGSQKPPKNEVLENENELNQLNSSNKNGDIVL
ncbi:nose resistant to fluoxetine protein 6-like [Condylostylus longicornis]|uniref:nose resistant to fluoxetine protein 6-like n=1 Tax=Condylostylus longicornis TaxID=2530218 RepID=UPI00244DF649|nr:nose resistant to fluoxetine protein 6-like [Condylostylus longicornis]